MVFNFRTYSSSSESVQDDPTPPRSFSLEEGSFSLAEIRAATDNFSHDNLLAEGENFKVYRGRLADGSRVAVKRACRVGQLGKELVGAEIQVGSTVSRHPNVLCLRGFCRTNKELLLVYPLMINNSLSYHLTERPDRFARPLDWTTRKQIALGAARGLAHLHNQGSIKIMHRNICASNILLNVHFEAVIGGSSLAVIMHEGNMEKETFEPGVSSPRARRLLSRSTTYHPSVFQRYNQYEEVYVKTTDLRRFLFVDPYLSTGMCTLKNDVFAYGRMLLELISGTPSLGPFLLLKNVYLSLDELIGDSSYKDMSDRVIDPNLRGNYVKEEAELLLRLGMLCSDKELWIRPEMSEVVRMLESQFHQRDTSTRSSWSQSDRDLTLHYSFFENKKQKTRNSTLLFAG